MAHKEKWFEDGWDNGVDKFEEQFGKNFWTELYKYAYKFMKDGDADGGICFKIREDAVQHLLALEA